MDYLKFAFISVRLSAVKFSPNGNVVCAGFEDSSVRLWSLKMKKLGQTSTKTGTSKPGTAHFQLFVFICNYLSSEGNE